MVSNRESVARTAKPNGPVGLGGWLVLLGIGLILAPFKMFAEALEMVSSDLLKSLLIKPEFLADDPYWPFGYHPWWKPLLIFDLLGNAGIIILSLILPVLFFRRSRHFPSVFIATGVIAVASILVSAWLWSSITGIPMFNYDAARALGSWCIWVPYLALSKRVQSTFV